MALFGPSTATATVAANTNAVTIAGMDLTVVTPGMTISFGARDRKKGDAWIIGAVAANGTNGGTLTLAGSVPDAYSNTPFVIDTTGYLGTDASYAAAIGLAILSTLATLFGVATNLYSGARQLVLDKVSASTVGRIAFAIAGRSWGDIAHRTLTYNPTGGQAASTETLALRAFPDGTTPADVLLIDLSAGTGDLRKGSVTMASAATVDLGSAPAGKVTLTGTVTVASFGPGKNLERLVRIAESGLTLTHSASLVLPNGGANILTRAGDCFHAVSDGSGNWRVWDYQRADGKALSELSGGGTVTGDLTVTGQSRSDTLRFTRAINLVNGTDLNTVTVGGFYAVQNPVNGPGDEWWHLQVEQDAYASGFVLQRAVRLSGSNVSAVWIRNGMNGPWTAWKRMAATADAMQPVTGNSGGSSIPAGATRYLTHGLVAGSQSEVYVLAGRRGRFRNLRAVAPQAPGSGQSWKFTLQKLFSDTALTCTIAGTGTNQASDTTNSVVFEAHERWCVKVETSSGAAALSTVLFAMDFEVIE